MERLGRLCRSGYRFVHTKELERVLGAKKVYTGAWGIFVDYGDE